MCKSLIHFVVKINTYKRNTIRGVLESSTPITMGLDLRKCERPTSRRHPQPTVCLHQICEGKNSDENGGHHHAPVALRIALWPRMTVRLVSGSPTASEPDPANRFTSRLGRPPDPPRPCSTWQGKLRTRLWNSLQPMHHPPLEFQLSSIPH